MSEVSLFVIGFTITLAVICLVECVHVVVEPSK